MYRGFFCVRMFGGLTGGRLPVESGEITYSCSVGRLAVSYCAAANRAEILDGFRVVHVGARAPTY